MVLSLRFNRNAGCPIHFPFFRYDYTCIPQQGTLFPPSHDVRELRADFLSPTILKFANEFIPSGLSAALGHEPLGPNGVSKSLLYS